MSKIYLAGSCGMEHRDRMKLVAKYLREHGYTVYCPFELKIENAWDYQQEEWAQKVFDCDIMAIDNCDFMVMISDGRMSSAGTNFEQGYAYAKCKPIFVFQYTNAPASLMTYCGCLRYFDWLYGSTGDGNGDDEACAEYIGQFPFEDVINGSEKYPSEKEEAYVTLT